MKRPIFRSEHHHSLNMSVRVQEHRAPTDESVRLLKDMEKEAREKIFALSQTTNEIAADWYFYSDQAAFGIHAVCRYSVNGTEHTFKTTVPDRIQMKGRESIIREVIEKFCEHFKSHFLALLIAEANSNFRQLKL